MPAVFFKNPPTKKPNPQKTNKLPKDVYGKVCFRHKISSSSEIIMEEFGDLKEWNVSTSCEQYELLTSGTNQQ